jgi:HSP20 family protein
MAIQRWDPFHDLVQMQQRMNRMFEEYLARSGAPGEVEALAAGGFRPPLDLVELPERYLVRADLPGVDAAKVQLEIEGGKLNLTGERTPDPSIPREAYLKAERPFGRFAIQLALPPSVDRQQIVASHKDGVLEVTLPKRRQEVPGRIKVDAK